MRIDKVLIVLTFSILLGGGLIACTSTNTLAATPAAKIPPIDYAAGVKAYLSGDFKHALAVWIPLAEQGLVEAQYNLGHMYRKGQGVPQNHKTAVKWYTLAAEKGEAVAQFNLGLMYENGEGVAKNDKAALNWLTLAAEQGHPFAQYNLGVIYARGRTDFTDYERAYMWSNLSSYNEKTSGAKIKQLLGNIMTSAQITKAEEMSSRCLDSGYTDC
jgi:TPR repeat protein|tara:strand:+ start:945 stop:1589 length:645 start_codon:yes stop_codon:yes gene_type:complete